MRASSWCHRQLDKAPERGSSVVGLVVLTPVMAMLLFFVIAAGRVGVVESKLITAARNAARAATQSQSVSSAQTAATAVADATLNQLKVSCRGGPQIRFREIDLRPGGTVDVQISCAVRLSDLTVPGMPGSRTVSADIASVVDRYRSGNP